MSSQRLSLRYTATSDRRAGGNGRAKTTVRHQLFYDPARLRRQARLLSFVRIVRPAENDADAHFKSMAFSARTLAKTACQGLVISSLVAFQLALSQCFSLRSGLNKCLNLWREAGTAFKFPW